MAYFESSDLTPSLAGRFRPFRHRRRGIKMKLAALVLVRQFQRRAKGPIHSSPMS